jgi:hypothetical protein
MDLSRKLTEVIRHMLTRNQPLRSGRRPFSSSGLTALNGIAPPERSSRFAYSSSHGGDIDLSAAHHHHTARGPQPHCPPHLTTRPLHIDETRQSTPGLSRAPR